MNILELFILAVGLSMDAFAVSICKGLSLGKIQKKHMAIAGAWFGGFQALMPLIGYFAGRFFAEKLTQYDHWVAFILLLFIGGSMIKESLDEEEESNDAMDIKTMFLLAVATSIDALAVGISLAFLNTDIWSASILIGVVTFAIAAFGGLAGFKLGAMAGKRADVAGGLVLIFIGVKILLEHTGII